jgi:hypothetical protein
MHEVHRRIDAILPVIDASYRRRAIAESLVTIDIVIAAHLKTVSDPESASAVIRGLGEAALCWVSRDRRGIGSCR